MNFACLTHKCFVAEIWKWCLCLLIREARTDLLTQTLLSENSCPISRSAKQPLGQLGDGPPVSGHDLEMTLMFCSWLMCQTKLKVRFNSSVQTCWVTPPPPASNLHDITTDLDHKSEGGSQRSRAKQTRRCQIQQTLAGVQGLFNGLVMGTQKAAVLSWKE